MKNERLHFIKLGAAAMAALTTGLPNLASANRKDCDSRPIGLQLYTLGYAVEQDPAKVFALLAAFGYREVEALTYAKLAPSELRRHASNAGLLLRSAHLDFATKADPSDSLDIARQLGVVQVVSSVLPPTPQDVLMATGRLTISDFQRMAARAKSMIRGTECRYPWTWLNASSTISSA